MKKNVYYQTMYSYPNPIKAFLSDLFFTICSYPRLILSVHVRKNFGERAISLPIAISIFLLLLLLPMIQVISPWSYRHPSLLTIIFENISWYAFTGLFLVKSWQRHKEVKRVASEFNFRKFTKYGGDLHPAFFNFKFNGKRVSIRTIETLVEPAFFLLIGITLILFAQKIGIVISLFSLMYSLSYYIAYWRGDTIILDMIDQIIANEVLFDVFTENDDRASKDGFRVFGNAPVDPNLRSKVANNLRGVEDEAFEVV